MPAVVARVYQVLRCPAKPRERLVILSTVRATGCTAVELHHVSLANNGDRVESKALQRRGYVALYPLIISKGEFDSLAQSLGLFIYYFTQASQRGDR